MPKSSKAISSIEIKMDLSEQERESLLKTLQDRFQGNMNRHQNINWDQVKTRLKANPTKLASLHAMESTGGEPDVIGYDQETNAYLFCDCSAESPEGRRSTCYDEAGLAERVKKGIHPAGNAVELARDMGIDLLTEEQYHALQELGEFDTKTSSWIKTPTELRERGGAIFGDRRFGRVFIYHNGAQSFYAARGFRGLLTV